MIVRHMIPSLTPPELMVLEMLWDLTEGKTSAPASAFTDEQLAPLDSRRLAGFVTPIWIRAIACGNPDRYAITLAGMGALLPVYVEKLRRANAREAA